ncbi:MAG: archaeal heat shock protein Hsp20 [Archaeoglobaceae archaeon]
MPWRRRRRDWNDLFDEIFGNEFEYFDEIAEKMFKDLDEFFRTSMTSMKGQGAGFDKPFVKGFSIKMGPEGKPEIKEFGNKSEIFRGSEAGENSSEERRPLIDVMKGDEEVNVIAEMPGVNKEDIDISASETAVDIKAEGTTTRYSESVDLGCEVIPDSAKARYNNGVLEIVFKRKEPKKEVRKKVDIE